MSGKVIMALGISLLCSVSVLAQTPSGYLGKRLIVSYNFGSFPRFYNVLFDQELVFRYKHTIEIEYITQRKQALGVSFSYHDFEAKLENYSFQDFGKDPAYAKNRTPIGPNTVLANKSTYTGIFYRIFHNNIAPLGIFSRFGVDQIISNVSLENVETSMNSNVYIPSIRSTDQYYSLMVSYSIGSQRVLFDRLLVRFAVKSGYVFGGLKQTRLGIVDVPILGRVILDNLFEIETDKYNYEQQVVKNSLLNQNFISVTLGIGFLVY